MVERGFSWKILCIKLWKHRVHLMSPFNLSCNAHSISYHLRTGWLQEWTKYVTYFSFFWGQMSEKLGTVSLETIWIANKKLILLKWSKEIFILSGLNICINRLIDLTRKWPAVTFPLFFFSITIFFNLVGFYEKKPKTNKLLLMDS